MGFMDGIVVLDGEQQPRKNNNNQQKKNFNNNNKKKFDNNGRPSKRRSFSDNDLSFRGSSYLSNVEFDEEEDRVDTTESDKRADKVIGFCENFASNTDNFRTLQDILIEEFPEVIPYIKKYYDSRNTPMFQDALNKLIKIMCTTHFANTLNSVLESKVWENDGVFGDIWDSIGFGLSLALETNHERMHADVIRKYVTKIIPRLFKPEISDIRSISGVTGDLALDLIIALPVAATDWTGATLDAFYQRFLDKMLIHAEDNMDILNWEVQGVLYEKFFGKSKTALKVIGKYLTSEPIQSQESPVVNAVYAEFQKMLYSKLDNYDIGEIEYVLSFVAKKRQENPDKDIMFNSVRASEYDNVRKALISTMDRIPETKKYLA